MEEEEQDTIAVDKSLIEGDGYTFDKSVPGHGGYKANRKHLRYYYSGQSISEKKPKGKVFEHDDKYYLITGYCGDEVNGQEVVPLEPGMPSLHYGQHVTIQNWTEGYQDDISDELAELGARVEQYFNGSIARGTGYLGVRFESKKRIFVTTARRVRFVAKKHGNQIQDAFAWANPAQEEMKL